MEGKSRLASKTVWLGVAMTIVSVLGLLAGEEWIQAYPAVVSALGLVAGLLVVIVRHWTTEPLKAIEPNEPPRRKRDYLLDTR